MKKYLKTITAGALALVFCFPVLSIAQDKDMNQVENITKNEDRRAEFEKVKAEIEAINNDSNLTQEEKDLKIKAKRSAFSKRVSKTMKEKRTKYREELTDEQKEAIKSMRKEDRVKYKQKLKSELDAIESNPDLSEEQKKESKNALVKAHKDEWKAKRAGGKLGSHGSKGHKYGKANKNGPNGKEVNRKAHKAERKAQREAIINDATKTEEEKEVLLKDMRDEHKAKHKKHKGHKGHHKGHEGYKQNKDTAITKGESVSKDLKKEQSSTSKKLNKRFKKLDKKLAKGKITQEEYIEQLNELELLKERELNRQ